MFVMATLPHHQIEAMETKVSTLNNLLHTKPSPSLSHHSPHTHKVRKPSVKKLVKKITRKSTKHKGATPMSLLEDKANDTKFSMLKEGEVRGWGEREREREREREELNIIFCMIFHSWCHQSSSNFVSGWIKGCLHLQVHIHSWTTF